MYQNDDGEITGWDGDLGCKEKDRVQKNFRAGGDFLRYFFIES